MRAHRVRQIAGVAGVTLVFAVGVIATAQGQLAKTQRRPTQKVIVPAGGDVNRAAPDGTTPLHVAVRAGDMARVQALLRAGANVKAATRYANVTPLALAAINGDAAMVDVLIKAGADPKTANAEGETVLMTAARTGNPQAVKTLIDHGADVNAREGWYEQTALMWAAAQNNAEAAKVLIAAGADLNARATVPPKPAGRGRAGGSGNPTPTPPGGLTPLLYAARNGAIESIRVLADAGASLDLADPNAITPLVYALINGHYGAAAALLEKGANPNIVDITGRGPLYVAVDMHTLEFRGPSRPDPKLDERLTPLDLIKMLLDRGANVNQKLTAGILAPKAYATGNRNLTAGSTPFLKAATTSDVEVMRLLLAHGADPKVTNKSGTNALIMAAGLGWRVTYNKGTQDEAIESIKLCMELGMDINAANDNGDTALHGAASRTTEQDANKLIEFLVAKGANLYAKNKKGRTPLDESEGEEATPENGGADRRAMNTRTRALLRELMQKYPDRQVAAQSQ